jgi:(1->4)-alpha-D-glucan 1-alpha-D-glucosylmutase
VPATYPGTEGEDLPLVDPDNRRPVDYTLRRKALAAFDAGLAVGEAELKIGVLATALRLRRARPDLLGPAASYGALLAAGSAAAHCVAFVRGRGAVTVVPRLVAGLARRGGWADTKLTLPPGRWRDLLGGSVGLAGDVRLADLLGDASPTGVALLVADT